MKAVRYHRYGSPDVLGLHDVDRPRLGDDDVLVRVKASSVNPLDLHFMRGTPHLLRISAGMTRPRAHGLGTDLAGYVETVGRNVTGFRPGDDVFGAFGSPHQGGTLAEYVAIGHHAALHIKPVTMTYEQAAAVPVAACTALQALRDKGGLRPGQAVLINGAAGGVGTFAVQLAKAFGAEVTAVCSSRNVGLLRSIGADRAVDYTKEDFTRTPRRYDLLVDLAGNRALTDIRRVIKTEGALVAVGGPLWSGPILGPLRMFALAAVRSAVAPLLAKVSRADLELLRELIETQKVTSVIDRTYPLTEAAAAFRYVATRRARGKVVIAIT